MMFYCIFNDNPIEYQTALKSEGSCIKVKIKVK